MSKKDLLERLNRPSDGSPLRRTDSSASRPEDDVVTKRVSKKVVRRRRRKSRSKPAEQEAAAAAPAEASEAADAPATPAPEAVEAKSADTGTDSSTPAAEPTPAADEAPAPEAASAAAADTADAAASDSSGDASSAEATKADTSDAPAAKASDADAKADAASDDSATKAPAEEKSADAASSADSEQSDSEKSDSEKSDSDKADTPQQSQDAPADPAVAAKADSADGSDAKGEKKEEEKQFPGLGKAVVMPPPGYDPANPHAWRRQESKPPASPTDKPAKRGRRRVEAGAGRNDRGRGGRRGRGRGGFDHRMRRKPRRRKRSSGPKTPSPTPKASKRKVRVDHVISVRDLAKQLQLKASVVLKTLIEMGHMANITEMLDIDTAELVAEQFDYEVENVGFQEEEFLQHVGEEEEDEDLEPRPPVVTIMGHVDHGKTTLLDTIRSSRVAIGEAGGITQHIGAYQVDVDGTLITFLDTPGHAAFTDMRARGADVTDIVILVVAADDGVMPQTAEAIQHSKAAGVPIIVAVNKMDKAGANPDNIKTQLTEHELIPEEWGGETLFAPVSALKGEGIDELLEQVKLQAEILELAANPDRHAEGAVIEAQMERGRGAVATVLVQQGTLKRGDHVVLGSAFGRVRAMVDHRGKRLKAAGPSTPVELFGLSELPEVGDTMAVVANEKNARTLAEHRAEQKKLKAMSAGRKNTLEELYAAAARGELERLHIVLKADVQGTLQALVASLEKIEVEGTELNILLSAVGDISESDVNLAASDNAMLIGFNVRLDSKARQAADEKGVEAEIYSVIYALLETVEARLKGMLAPEYEHVLNGSAEVRKVFRISKVGAVAGSYILDGTIARSDHAKVLRDGEQLWEGGVKQLKRFKDDVREVKKGFECGISLEGFNDLEEGDIIEAYRLEEVERD